MEKSDFDVALEHFLAVELEIKLDRPMGRRMGRAHLQFHDLRRKLFGFCFHRNALNLAAQRFLQAQ